MSSLVACVSGAAALAQDGPSTPRQAPFAANVVQIAEQRIVWHPRLGTTTNQSTPTPRGCPPVTASVANQFDAVDVGAEITLQAGMVDGEGFGSTYIVADPNPGTPENEAFPIEVSLVEFLCGTAATGIGDNINLGYRIEVWDGNPGTGSLAFSVDSDPDPDLTGLPPDAALARVTGVPACNAINVLLGGASASALKVQFSVDQTADPLDRMLVQGNSGTGRVSIMVYITRHNQPPAGGDPCASVNLCNNAFFATEGTTINGQSNSLNNSTRNWLYAIQCPLAAPEGYTSFNNLSATFRPTRDLLQQVTYLTSACAGVFTGRCCLPSGGCTVTSSASCDGQSGTYAGDNTTCTPNPCPQPTGRCCNPVTGDCTVVTQASCTSSGGTNFLADAPCSPNPCPQPVGACCFGSSCLNLNSMDCASIPNSTWQGGGTACGAGNTCPLGACCLPNGNCVAGIGANACAAQSGTFQGVGTTCTPNNCPQPAAACCLSNDNCLTLTAADCGVIPGSSWQGFPSVCSPNPCLPPVCPLDISGNEIVDADDIFGFLNIWFAGPPGGSCSGCQADWNSSGLIDADDIFAFLNNWFAFGPGLPCP